VFVGGARVVEERRKKEGVKGEKREKRKEKCEERNE